MPVSFVFVYAHPVAQRYNIGEYEKYLFFPLYGNTENPFVTVHAPRID